MFMLSVNGYSIFFTGNIEIEDYDILDDICQKISKLEHNNNTELLFQKFSEEAMQQMGKNISQIKIQRVFRIE